MYLYLTYSIILVCQRNTKPQTVISRRRFNQLALGTAGAAILASQPWLKAIAAPETQAANTPGFGTLPLVEGEKLNGEPYINHDLLGFIGDLKLRNQPEATGESRKTPIGSVMRVDKKDVKGLNNDPHTWAGGEIVYDSKQTIEEAIAEDQYDENISTWAATDIPGATAFITDPTQVPDELKPIYVTEPKGLPIAILEYPIDSLVDLFSKGVGGEETLALP